MTAPSFTQWVRASCDVTAQAYAGRHVGRDRTPRSPPPSPGGRCIGARLCAVALGRRPTGTHPVWPGRRLRQSPQAVDGDTRKPALSDVRRPARGSAAAEPRMKRSELPPRPLPRPHGRDRPLVLSHRRQVVATVGVSRSPLRAHGLAGVSGGIRRERFRHLLVIPIVTASASVLGCMS